MTDKNPSVEAAEGDVVIEVVGKRPENTPYLWVGNVRTAEYLGSFDERSMRKLRDAITKALGDA